MGRHGAIPHRFSYLEARDIALVHLADDIFYDPLRSDPRIDDLLRGIGF